MIILVVIGGTLIVLGAPEKIPQTPSSPKSKVGFLLKEDGNLIEFKI